jgi:hypothetical protein
VLRDFKLFLQDCLWWNGSTFMEVTELHRNGPFERMELNGAGQVFANTPEMYLFLHLETERLMFQGSTQADLKQHNLRTPGIWEASFSLQAGPRSRVEKLLFKWPPDKSNPEPFQWPPSTGSGARR